MKVGVGRLVGWVVGWFDGMGMRKKSLIEGDKSQLLYHTVYLFQLLLSFLHHSVVIELLSF